jgi:hypothetical protein
MLECHWCSDGSIPLLTVPAGCLVLDFSLNRRQVLIERDGELMLLTLAEPLDGGWRGV